MDIAVFEQALALRRAPSVIRSFSEDVLIAAILVGCSPEEMEKESPRDRRWLAIIADAKKV